MALKKINHKAAIKTKSSIYEIYLGTFSDNEFTWYSVAKYSDPVKAYKEYKKYVNTQLKYTDEELKKVWDTGRLDVELRQGNKLLNWVGIYSRKVTDLTHEEEKESQLENKKKSNKQKKDAITPEILAGEVRKNLIEYLKSNNIVFDDLKVQARYELDPNQIDFVFSGLKNLEDLKNLIHTIGTEREGEPVEIKAFDYIFIPSLYYNGWKYVIRLIPREKINLKNLEEDFDPENFINSFFDSSLNFNKLNTIDSFPSVKGDIEVKQDIDNATYYIFYHVDPVRNSAEKIYGPYELVDDMKTNYKILTTKSLKEDDEDLYKSIINDINDNVSKMIVSDYHTDGNKLMIEINWNDEGFYFENIDNYLKDNYKSKNNLPRFLSDYLDTYSADYEAYELDDFKNPAYDRNYTIIITRDIDMEA